MKSFVDDLLNFEMDYGLFELIVGEFKYWHFIRYDIFHQLLEEKFAIGKPHSDWENNSINKYQYLLNLFEKMSKHHPYLNIENREIIFVRNLSKGKKCDSGYYDPIMDIIIDNIPFSYYIFEWQFEGKHFTSKFENSTRYFDYLTLMKPMLRLIYSDHWQYQSHVDFLHDKINECFNIDIPQKQISDLILNSLIEKNVLGVFYKRILEQIRPKILIEPFHYTPFILSINSLCKTLGIKTIELQHGAMGRYHIPFNFKKKVVLEGFPDYIFLFGRFWHDITRFPVAEERLIVTGFPHFEKAANCPKRILNPIVGKKMILFLSQGTIGKQMSSFASQLSKILDKNKYYIVYKLHPGEYQRWKDDYPWLVDNDISVVDNNYFDIYHYFSISFVQIGVYSTAILEGMGFGAHTILLNMYGVEYFEDLISEEKVELVNHPTEVIPLLEKFNLMLIACIYPGQ